MSIAQLNMFDYDIIIKKNDCIFRKINALQPGDSLYVEDIKIERTEKFYIVEKESDFEEVFRNVERCYEFVNRNLLALPYQEL
ncbi:hypothetical protein AAGS61_02860 [Lysinibacillus sp. KU-BSD001]|uniref:hypothetical protein n=1 Tax=Lysinibacillus sp. KU-BSD001 TaxID=3141328 RepID=UPI0036E17EA9